MSYFNVDTVTRSIYKPSLINLSPRVNPERNCRSCILCMSKFDGRPCRLYDRQLAIPRLEQQDRQYTQSKKLSAPLGMELKLRVSENNVLRALKYLARHHELRERVIGSPMPWLSTLREGITFLKGLPPAMVCALFMYFDLTCQGALGGMVKIVQACGIRLPDTIGLDQLAVHRDHGPRTHTIPCYQSSGTFVENSMHLLEEFSSQRSYMLV